MLTSKAIGAPPHTHTVLKTPMQFLLLLTQRLPLAVDTMDVDFCFYSLSVLNPVRETALESRALIDKGHVSLISERMGSWKSGSLIRILRFDRTSVSSSTVDINRAAAWLCWLQFVLLSRTCFSNIVLH